MSKYHVQAGGKLYLIGEYAVLKPGQTALICYIPIMLTAVIEAAEAVSISSDMFDHAADLSPDKDYRLIQASIEAFSLYVDKDIKELPAFSLSITGKLERDGKKFGIGSSGSVVVLTLRALAAFYQVQLLPEQLFKLAAYTLLKSGDNGSMGDIACIAYESVVAYTSFDRRKVGQWLIEMTLQELMAAHWGYTIEIIEPALSCWFLVGWTQVPSISREMIQLVNKSISCQFLEQSQRVTQEAMTALQLGQRKRLKASIEKAGQLLQGLASVIYHPKLMQLVKACQGLDAAAKSSGSGGGDCGIALVFEAKDIEPILARWQQAGIVLLYQEEWG